MMGNDNTTFNHARLNIGLMKPQRPGFTPNKPQIVVKQPSIDRSSRSMPSLDGVKHVSADDSDLMYSRVSMTLMEDPDIQNAIFKSASAENLPKANPALKTCDSSGTITSTSSFENEGEPDNKDGGYRLKGDKSALVYSALLEDDDSGIVMRTSSHTSLDQYKGEATQSYSADSSKMDSKLPPPKPLPRKGMSPSVGGGHIEDSLIRGRERPQPAPRKPSFGSSGLPSGQNAGGDMLIDFGAKTPENEISDLSDDFSGLNSSGDYVLLREPKTYKSADTAVENRRISITRTPALKLGQDETPKRPSIRRERSPITPEKEEKGPDTVVDFDPLFNSNNSASVNLKNSNNSSNRQAQHDDSDSLLKDWNIGGLVSLSQTPKQNFNQTNYSYTAPTPPPRQPINSGMPRYYTPQPFTRTDTQTGSSSVGFQNPLSQSKQPPLVAPRPNPRHSIGGGQQSAKSCLFPTPTSTQGNQSDPFGDLLSLNKPDNTNTANQSSSNWETFN